MQPTSILDIKPQLSAPHNGRKRTVIYGKNLNSRSGKVPSPSDSPKRGNTEATPEALGAKERENLLTVQTKPIVEWRIKALPS